MAGSFARRGYPLLLTSATVTDRSYLERMQAASPTDNLLMVRLTAPPEVLRTRLIRREPEDWIGLPRLLAAVMQLAESMSTLPGIDVVLATEAHSIEQVASMIVEALVG